MALVLGASEACLAANNIVGLSVPLSGKASALGRQYVEGARFALQHLPDGKNIELFVSDDGCDKELAELAISDISNSGAQLITGFLCNAAVDSALALINDKNIPLLVSGARSNRILDDRKRYGWNVWQFASRDADVSLAASKALSKRWENIAYAIVDDGTVFGRTQADKFRALMEESGVKPQYVDNFRPAQSTQAGLIRRLKKSGVDAVYLAAGGDDVTLIARNMVEFGFTIEIATGENLSLLPYLEGNHDIPAGILALMAYPPEGIDAVRALDESLALAKLEPEPYLLLGYATMQIAIAYFKQNKQDFSNAKYSTILGDINFDDAGRNLISHYHLFRWDGANFTIVEQE